MAVARWLETDSLSNQNIASAAAIGAYTADADRLIVADVSLDQVAGNGDYVIYLTRQIAGAGSAYVMQPKTTCTAASGETALAMQSGMISVRSGDVLTCYVDGLAGDTTTVDTVVRWFEMAALRPATAGRTLAVNADGYVTVTDFDATAQNGMTDAVEAGFNNAGGALEATLTEIKGADGDTLKTLSDQIDGLPGLFAASGATITVISAVDGGKITLHVGDTWSFTVTDSTLDLSGYENVALVVKRSSRQVDDDALLYLRSDTGLQRIGGDAPVAAGNGTLSKTATSFTALVALAETSAAGLIAGSYTWWLKGFDTTPTPDTGFTLATGEFVLLRAGLAAVV